MILFYIVNILEIAIVNLVIFYTNTFYNSIKIVLKIHITNVSYITFMFFVLEIIVNNIVYDNKKNQSSFLYFQQTIINLDIFR